MTTKFQLDNCYSLVVGGHIPDYPDGAGLVAFRLMYQPMPVLTQGSNEPGGWVYAPESQVFGVHVKPSHARAIASAILAEATETRKVQ